MSRYIEKRHVIHIFSPDHVSTASTRPGETLIFKTYDCYTGQLLREGPDFDHMDKSLANPTTGPVYIEGACPQNILRLAIRSIKLDQMGILDKGPTVGTLKEHFPEYIIRRSLVEDGMVHHGHLQTPIRPMIDVIDTAPEGHVVSTLAPGGHGGNIGYTSTGSGAVLYLLVQVPGALLAMGDPHAVMGNGECGNCGVETGDRVTVQVGVVKNHPAPWPLVETGDRQIAIASRKNVDEVCQRAMDQMSTFLTIETGFSKLDMGTSIDMLGNLAICQIVNPQRTVRLEVPERSLERLGFYGSVDQESITHGLRREQEVCP